MKFLNYNKVLCLSPHPDDVEYGMSGTIMKYYDTQFDVLCLTKGGKCDETTKITNRHKECINFWKDVPNVNLLFIEHDSLSLGEDFLISHIESEYIDIHDLIMVPSKFDNHFFHTKVNNLGPALCRVSPISLIEYYTPSSSLEWIPNIVVNIDNDIYDNKKVRLQEFKSQLHRKYFSDFCLNSFHSSLQFTKKGLHWVEKFRSILTILE
jgi:LmbE family N-acetylglucosaminyl deacetylase